MPNISYSKLLGYGPITLSIMCIAMVFNYVIIFGSTATGLNKAGAVMIFEILMALQIPMIAAYFFLDLNEEYKVKMRTFWMQLGVFALAGMSAFLAIR